MRVLKNIVFIAQFLDLLHSVVESLRVGKMYGSGRAVVGQLYGRLRE